MTCPRCHSPLVEDLSFLRDMLSMHDDRRQWRCLNGHSVIVGTVPTLPRSRGHTKAQMKAQQRKNRLRWKRDHPLVGRRGPDRRAHEIAMGDLGRGA